MKKRWGKWDIDLPDDEAGIAVRTEKERNGGLWGEERFVGSVNASGE